MRGCPFGAHLMSNNNSRIEEKMMTKNETVVHNYAKSQNRNHPNTEESHTKIKDIQDPAPNAMEATQNKIKKLKKTVAAQDEPINFLFKSEMKNRIKCRDSNLSLLKHGTYHFQMIN